MNIFLPPASGDGRKDRPYNLRKNPVLSKMTGFFVLCLLLLTGLSVFSGCNQADDPTMGAPDRLYDEAWRILDNEYVDAGFNGQDWSHWRHHYAGQLKDYDDAYVAIQTMAASLNDEYTRFLSPRAMDEQTMSIDSRLYGVGIQISMRDNKLVVVTTIDDTPAERAGLMSKDLITHIDGHETAGMSVEDAADRIRGERGTYVTLTIRRDGQKLVKRIMRDEIKLKSVFSRKMNDPRIGYIRLSSFISETMMDEMYQALAKNKSKQGLILDLRGNYGGLFTNALDIADLFLDKGVMVYVVNRDHNRRVYEAHSGVDYSGPMVVLIDGGSASASEILSGALKDNHRATLIGSQSFGKGLVQKINTLSNGAGLNITISKYLTPDGTDINKKGIAPDIVVPFSEADFLARRDPQLARAVQELESRLVAKK